MLSHNNIFSYLFTEMLFHLSLYHSGSSMATTFLYELIDPTKEAFSSSQPQKASTVETPLTARDIHYYPSSQPQRASAAENSLTTGDIYSYPSSQTLLPLEIFAVIHHPSHRRPQQQKTLLPLEIFTVIHHPNHKGP